MSANFPGNGPKVENSSLEQASGLDESLPPVRVGERTISDVFAARWGVQEAAITDIEADM